MARLSTEQQRNVATILQVGRQMGASSKVLKAAIEAGLVESGLRNVNFGDRDSLGVFQQRPSQGWGTPAQVRDVRYAATQFFKRAIPIARQHGSAGALAQAVQRSAFPAKYDQQSSQAAAILGGTGGGPVGSGGGQALVDASTPASAPQEVAQGSQGLLPLIAALTQARPQARASGGLPMPSFGAHPALPGGYQIPVTGGGPAPKQDLNPLLAAIQTMGGNVPQAATQSATQGGTPQGAADLSSVTSGKVTTRGFPTGRAGKLIGFPHQGTHTLGNWQSDNAVDISVPVGTPMVALDNGVVVKVRQHPQGAGRFAGDQVTIRGANGNSYFYAHGVAGVKAGQRVRAGQVIGTTGSANGVAHLHFGVERGDPRQIIGRRR